MIGLNSTERIKQAIKDLNESLPDDAYSVDELVEYKKWYSQAAKNKLQISQTCKDWFEGVFALLIPYGVDYYKTKYRDTSLYNIKPVNFSIDILKEIAGFGFAKHLEQDVNEIIYNNLIRRINQKEMTKLKEVNTYTLEEIKWYKFWYDSRAVIKPSLDSKFKEALDEESKTEIEFDLDDLKLIKSGADNYYNYCVRDDYKMSIEEDDILDKLDARISFLRKKIIHQHTKDVFNSPVNSSAEDEEIVSNAYVEEQETVFNAHVEEQEEKWTIMHLHTYSTTNIYWINKWCENILKVTESLKYKCDDASREIFKLTGKKPEAVDTIPYIDVYVFFSLKELKEIRNYASMYYSSNEKTVEAKDTLYDINLRIKYLEKQSEKILDALRKGYDETQAVMLETNTYNRNDIDWYAEWVLDKFLINNTISNIILCCMKTLNEADSTGKHPNTTICYMHLEDLKEIRKYVNIHYNDINHDFPDRKRSDKEIIALCRLDEKIAFMEEYKDAKLKFYVEKEEKMKKEAETNCKPATEIGCKSENPNAFIMCECRGIATGMCDVELRLSNVIRECIKHGYDVEYKYNDNCISKGYIQSGEMIHNLKNNTVFFKIEFVSTNDDCEFDIYSKNLDLKAIRFDDKTNTLHLQQNA